MSLMVGMEGFDRFLPTLLAVSHPHGAPLQLSLFLGKGMRLKIMNHLQFVFDVA